jgi:hypothetical protein
MEDGAITETVSDGIEGSIDRHELSNLKRYGIPNKQP